MNHIVNERGSGYAATVEDWKIFISCWREKRKSVRERWSGEMDASQSVVGDYLKQSSVSLSDSELNIQIRRAEEKFGFTLPKSYVDFIRAFRPSRKIRFSDDGSRDIGFAPLADIERLGLALPGVVNDYSQYPIESSDENYLIYGADQDGLVGRTDYLSGLIIVGMYGGSSFEFIALNPFVVTKDGEFEASLYMHSSEFRAPSFAELMRQLSVVETEQLDVMPPYTQEFLKGTCANRLPMRNVWWK